MLRVTFLLSAILFLLMTVCQNSVSQNIKLHSSEGYIITADTTHLFYKIIGEGKDTILIIHGGIYNSGYILPDLTPLAAHYTLLFYDLRGAGYSSQINEMSRFHIDKYIGDIETIRKHFKLKSLNILAHSTGGLIAGIYASKYPKKIQSLILVNPLPAKAEWPINFDDKMDSISILVKNQNFQKYKESPIDSVKACWDYYALVARGFYSSTVQMRRMWGDVCNCNQFNLLNPLRNAIFNSLGVWDITSALNDVKAPTLIVASTDDGIPYSSFEQWQKSLPNSVLISIPNSRHFPHVENPNVFFPTVEEFLRTKKTIIKAEYISGAGVVLQSDKAGSKYKKERAKIITIENELIKNINNNNWKAAANIYNMDATIIAPGSPPISGRQAIASFWNTISMRGMKSVELQLMDIESSGTILIAKGKYNMMGAKDTLLDVGKFMAIYHKVKNNWVLQTDIFNTSMETQSPLEIPDYLYLEK